MAVNSNQVSSDRKELKANWKSETEVPVIDKKELSKHSSKSDLWIAIHGKVYNVTDYARDHPGGLDSLLEVAGQDATSAYEDVGHSEDAREIMHSLLVGSLKGGSPGSKVTASNSASTVQIIRSSPPEAQKKSNSSFNAKKLAVAAAATGASALVYAAAHSGVIHKVSLPHAHPLHLSGGEGAFTHGFFLAGALSTAVGFAAFKYLSSMLEMGHEYEGLPAHKPSANAAFRPHHPSGVLLPQTYQKFKLEEKTELANGIWRFVFALPSKYAILGLPIGQHIAIRGYVGEETITRSYTPISNNRDLGRLECIIRLYPDGKLAQYLSAIKPGDKVEIRGPKGAMRYRKGMVKHLGMVGGGTGITPLFQVVRAICEDPTDKTTVSLIYGNRSEQDIMLRETLDRFAKENPDQFKVHYVLDHPPEGWTGGKGYVDKNLLQEKMPAVSDDTKILLCGPPGMVNATKNNLGELGFKLPGAVSKMEDQIFCF